MKGSYLSLLIFCAILSQGFAVISNENIEKISNLQIRRKRIINNFPGGMQSTHVTLARHLVQVLNNDSFKCAGNILQTNIILTVKSCLQENLQTYAVTSGSLTRNLGIPHRILAIVQHPISNIALLRIHPPIRLGSSGDKKITFISGIPPMEMSAGLLSGWGCTKIIDGVPRYSQRLMSALIPIITFVQCQWDVRRLYRHILPADAICTLDTSGKRSACDGDEGGSLVYGNRLIGIYSFNGGVNLGVHPDVYVGFFNVTLVQWITQKSTELQARRFRNL